MQLRRTDGLAFVVLVIAIVTFHFFGLSIHTALIPLGVLLAFILDGIFRPSAPWFLPVITHATRSVDAIALTFDDGPDPTTTPQILELLKQHRAKATFFVIGRHVQQHPELARRIVAEGHEIGNHTHHHARLFNTKLRAAMQQDIEMAQQAIQTITGITPQWFRPPVGLKNPQLILALEPLQLRTVLWSVHARDTLLRNPQQIAQRVLRKLRAGDIVDLHDGHDKSQIHRLHTVAAVAEILAALPARGLRAVTVSDLLQCGTAQRLD